MKLADDGPAGRTPGVPPGRGEHGGPSLTRRELEVLAMAAAGASSGETAERLGISRSTVNGHLRSVSRKLGTTDRAAAVRRYLLDDLA